MLKLKANKLPQAHPKCSQSAVYLTSKSQSRKINSYFNQRTRFPCTVSHAAESDYIASQVQLETVGKAKLLTEVEIPAFIERSDMLKQLVRWATMDCLTEGVNKFGVPFQISLVDRDELTWGFILHFIKDGESGGDLLFSFDEKKTKKYQYILRTRDGWPSTDGVPFEEVAGKKFQIWRVQEDPFPSDLQKPAKDVLESFSQAVNRYYSFGSVFSEDL